MFKYLFLLLNLFSIFYSTNSFLLNKKTILLNQSNFISIKGEINEFSTSNFVDQTKYITSQDDVYIYIDSIGGQVFEGLKIIQYINYLNQNHNIICISQNAYSMAFVIFQHCPRRLILENSILMHHEISTLISGEFENIKSNINLLNNIETKFTEKIILKSGLDKDFLYNKMINDFWIFSNEILSYNLADEIVYLGCDESLLIDKFFDCKKQKKIINYFKRDCPI